MSNTIKRIGAMLLLMVFLFSLTACGGGDITTSHEEEANSFVVLKTSVKSGTSETQEPEPVLYIYHTHSLETYYDGTSVIKVGKALADCLSETYGIKVIHDTTKYGEESAALAYEDSLKGLQSALKSNPEITHFLDIHRDAGRATYVRINGKKIAPVSLVIGKGTEYSGKEKPNFEQNQAFAMAIYEKLAAQSTELVYPLIEKDQRYNQHLPGTCTLINIGFDQNDFEDVAPVIPYLAEAIASALGIKK
jgi:stage II sporulation protein P